MASPFQFGANPATAQPAAAPSFGAGGGGAKPSPFSFPTTTTTTAAAANLSDPSKKVTFSIPATSSTIGSPSPTGTTSLTPQSTPKATPPTTSPFTFGAAKPSTTTTTTTTTTTAAPAAAGGFKFGAAAAPIASRTTDGDKKTPAVSPFNLGAAAGGRRGGGNAAGTPTHSTHSTPTPTTTPTATATPTVGLTTSTKPSQIKDKNLKEIIKKWTNELETNVQTFTRQAIAIDEWDRDLRKNTENILKLHDEVDSLSRMHTEVSQNVDAIAAQQGELEEILSNLESEVNAKFPARDHMSSADIERERSYAVAEDVSKSLNSLEDSLKEMIEAINAGHIAANDAENNPVGQIVSVLNAHLNSLQWIEDTCTGMEKKVSVVKKNVVDSRK